MIVWGRLCAWVSPRYLGGSLAHLVDHQPEQVGGLGLGAGVGLERASRERLGSGGELFARDDEELFVLQRPELRDVEREVHRYNLKLARPD